MNEELKRLVEESYAAWQAARRELGLDRDHWRGPEDGLPPIGAELQNQFREKRTVVAHDGDVIVCRCEESRHYRGYTPHEQRLLKPILSEEDKAVEKMLEVCKQGSVSYPTSEEMVRRLYRAGYRKQEDK